MGALRSFAWRQAVAERARPGDGVVRVVPIAAGRPDDARAGGWSGNSCASPGVPGGLWRRSPRPGPARTYIVAGFRARPGPAGCRHAGQPAPGATPNQDPLLSSRPAPFQVAPDTAPAATNDPNFFAGTPAGPGPVRPGRRQLQGHEVQVVRVRPARRHLRLPPDRQHRQLRDLGHPGPAGAGPERRAHPAVHPHRVRHRDADQEPGLDAQDADRAGLLQREHVRGVRVVPAAAPLRLGRLRAVPDRPGGVAVHGLRRVPERARLPGPRRAWS